MTQRDPIQAQGLRYASSAEFCKLFRENMQRLYRLAFLLTADEEKAEQCFVAALEDAIEGHPVFKNWARSWSIRTIIKNAIRVIAPMPGEISAAADEWRPIVAQSEADTSLNALAKLEPFERFVFVLSVLESYPDRECANLLSCRKQDVRDARVRALQQIGANVATAKGGSLAADSNRPLWTSYTLSLVDSN